jgi:hypothetical protein
MVGELVLLGGRWIGFDSSVCFWDRSGLAVVIGDSPILYFCCFIG